MQGFGASQNKKLTLFHEVLQECRLSFIFSSLSFNLYRVQFTLFIFLDIFLGGVWTFFEDFIEFVTILLLFYVLFFFFFLPRGMLDLSYLTRDRTCIPCIGRQSSNCWTVREAPNFKCTLLLWGSTVPQDVILIYSTSFPLHPTERMKDSQLIF